MYENPDFERAIRQREQTDSVLGMPEGGEDADSEEEDDLAGDDPDREEA
jgi:hypothetical protein